MKSYDLLAPGLIAKTGVLKKITLLSSKWEVEEEGKYIYLYDEIPQEEINEYSVVIVSSNLYKNNKINYNGVVDKYKIKFSCDTQPTLDIDTDILILLKSTSKLIELTITGEWAADYQYTNDWYNIKGLKFTAIYDTGQQREVTPSLSKWGSETGSQIATFSYSDGVNKVTAEKEYSNVVRKLERLDVTGNLENQWLNKESTLGGLEFTAYYNNNTNETLNSDEIIFTPEIWDKHSKLQALNLSYTERGITASYKRNYNILPKPEDLNVITSAESVKNLQFYLDRVDFTGSYVVVKFSDDSIKIFHIDNNTSPGVVTETEVHFIGGKIFYEDESVDNGLTYIFYDEYGRIVDDINTAKFYSVTGNRIEGSGDKYFVYYNKDLNNFLSMKKDWGYYTKSVGCSSTIGKENLKSVEDIISEGDPVTKDSIWDYLINTHNFNNAEGCDDWYIGSKDEIDIFKDTLNLSNVWSSQEFDRDKAYKLNSEGNWEESSKTEKASFIPIRSF